MLWTWEGSMDLYMDIWQLQTTVFNESRQRCGLLSHALMDRAHRTAECWSDCTDALTHTSLQSIKPSWRKQAPHPGHADC